MLIITNSRTSPLYRQKSKMVDGGDSASEVAASSEQLHLSDKEAEELAEWRDRLRPDMGKLRTLPTGKVDSQLALAQDYVEDLVEVLAGEDLKKQGIDLQVEVFSGDVPNIALDDDMSLEQEWEEENPGKPWPVRGWLGVPKDGQKPIYRMAVNLGMLRALETREELAFVVAQQAEILLDHDRQDPDNEERLAPNDKSYLEPWEMQSAADRAAVARMNRAGFNPRGALKALERLYTVTPNEFPEDDLQRGLVAAAKEQEHEGMRVAVVQTEVESYVRREEPTTAQPLTPLPEALKIEGPSEYEKDLDDPTPFLNLHKNLALQLAVDETPGWMLGEGQKPIEYRAIRLADASSKDQENALVTVAETLARASDRTPQQKVDGFLRHVLALDARPLPEDSPFSEASVKVVSEFLKENGQGWDASKFYAGLKGEKKSLHNAFVRDIVLNENFQTVVGNALPGLVEGVPAAWIEDRKAQGADLKELPNLIKRNQSRERQSWPLAAAIDQSNLEFIAAQDAQGLAARKGDSGANFAMEFSNSLLSLDKLDPRFQLRLRQAAEPLLEASATVREDHARLRLRPPLADSESVNAYLEQLGTSESYKPFSAEFGADLTPMLKDVALLAARQPDLVVDESRPVRYADGVERRLAELVEQSSGEEQKALLDTLSRGTEHFRRLPATSPRRAWLGKASRALAAQDTDVLVGQLSQPDLSQHSRLLKQTLIENYRLQPEDLPDTTTASLAALDKRREADEFKPDRKDYSSEAEYLKALKDYNERQDRILEVTDYVAAAEARLVLGRMALLGLDKEVSQDVASRLNLDTFQSVLKGGEEAVERSELLSRLSGNDETEYVGADPGAFIMDGFLAVQEGIEELSQWHELATRSIDFGEGGLEARVGTRRKLGDNLFPRLKALPQAELKEWMSKEHVMSMLSAGQTSELLVQLLGEQVRPGASPEALGKAVAELEESYKLTEEHAVAYAEMRDQVAQKAQLQPHNVDVVFPKKERGVTDISEAYTKQARALSGLLAVAREQSAQEQIDTIEYLMGRQKAMPPYLQKASESQSFAPITESLQTTRQELLEADHPTRVMVANSFLAGPSGIMRTKVGRRTVIEHFLGGLDPANRKLAEKIARGVLASHGDADTLAVAFIMGQKPEEPKDGKGKGKDGKMDEATILNRLFDAYGVPGIKMKQYLAFTSEFKDFKDAFEDAQDAALPLNYYQALKLVQDRFGDDWPKDLQIQKVLGSGSVNVAIRYFNEESGKREVVSLGREDIEESTRYDFKRFHKFIEELTKTPEDRETFGYVLGLLNLIEDSVALEFDKESAMAVQQHAYRTYKHQSNGWEVRSIDAHKVENLGLFMELAKGRTARKTYTEKPEVYKDAMQAMAAAEFGVLKGQTSKGNLSPKALFANPDFHDGQVLISEEDKTVTILDFGQAVPISNEEREGGLDILTIIGKAERPKSAARRLNNRYFGGKPVMTAEVLAPIMERKDRMDTFIHLLSALNQNGADVPLSSVHWILGVNRQLALAEKIGKPIDKEVRNMVITHKIWLPLGLYNTAHWAKEKAVEMATGLANFLGGWAFGKDEPPPQNQMMTMGAQPVEQTAVVEEKKESAYVWRPDFR